MADHIKLDIAIASYPHTAALLNGEVRIEGVNANFIRVIPQIAAYRRMVRQVEFDVCEIAPPLISLPALTAPLLSRSRFSLRVAFITAACWSGLMQASDIPRTWREGRWGYAPIR